MSEGTDLIRRLMIKGIQFGLFVMAACTLLVGCGSFGPKTMDRDQINYGNSIGENFKRQMLANIVKLRYEDMPVFVDVGSIVSGYSLSTTVSGDVGFDSSFTGGDAQSLGASGTYTDRPTITYMPKTGDEYLRAILNPVDPKRLLSLIQAGYSADLLFTWSVEAINGVHNWSSTASNSRSADPEFLEFVALLQELQYLGAIGFEVETDSETRHDVLLVLNEQDLAESTLQKTQRSLEIIGLDPDQDRYGVVYAPFKIDSDTLAIQTRSLIQMLTAMSGFIDVPVEHESFTWAGHDLSQISTRPFHVLSGPERPERSFVAVEYQDHWFWIENSDIASKRVFTLMLFVTTLTSQATKQNVPLLTIPTQ